MLLGAGRGAVADLGITTIAEALRPRVADIAVLDGEPPNVRLTLQPGED
jgi:diaminohydroxyphosphoribosylaminopyrimidine deaminase/5-amino-6-(5-phosphoribosylamino)uracil reductase